MERDRLVPLCLTHADWHHHVRDAFPLKPTLDGEGRLVVQDAVNQALARENEVARKNRRFREGFVEGSA